MTQRQLFDAGTLTPRVTPRCKPPCTAAPIGSGPEGETCKTCKHLARLQFAKVYLKCALRRSSWTGGAKTDIKAGWQACEKWEPVLRPAD